MCSQRLNRALANGGAMIPQQSRQLGRLHSLPIQLQSARVVDLRSAIPSNSINGSQYIRLPKLRRRAAELVPAAGVDDEEAAVAIDPAYRFSLSRLRDLDRREASARSAAAAGRDMAASATPVAAAAATMAS